MVAKSVSAKEKERNVSIINGVLKGALAAITVSLVAILLFAFIIKLTSIGDSFISPLNQAIKGISILMGCFYALKQTNSNGLVKGILVGVLYTMLSFLIFSLLNGQFGYSKTFVNDLLFGAIIGAICGVIAINFKR